MGKDILCDSGVLISLTTACLDNLLYFFSDNHGVRFLVPPSVEFETVDRPMQTDLRKHLFSAVRIKQAIDDGVITVVDADVENDARRIMDAANSLFYMKGRPLRLIHYGESELLALGRQVGVDSILIDERTSRLLIEAPFRLKEHLEKEFNVNIMVNKNSFRELASSVSSFSAIRSSELVMLAYEQGHFKQFEKLRMEALEAALYRVKFGGCSISFEEIGSYLSMVK